MYGDDFLSSNNRIMGWGDVTKFSLSPFNQLIVIIIIIITTATTIIRDFCTRAGLSPQTQETRLQFCPKAGIPLQTQERRLQFY